MGTASFAMLLWGMSSGVLGLPFACGLSIGHAAPAHAGVGNKLYTAHFANVIGAS